MNIPALVGALLIGLSLGLTGAGGSIITLPVLVYLAGLPPKEAVGLSLFVVGVAALVGAIRCLRAAEIHLKAGLMFALSGMAGAAGGAQLTPLVSGRVLMILFAILSYLGQLCHNTKVPVPITMIANAWRSRATGKRLAKLEPMSTPVAAMPAKTNARVQRGGASPK